MTELKAKYYKYSSKMGRMENPEIITQSLKDGVQIGAILPNEARSKYADILGMTLDNVSSDFMNMPYPESIRKSNTDSKKLIKLTETQDSEVLTEIKKRIEKEYSVTVDNGIYLWSK